MTAIDEIEIISFKKVPEKNLKLKIREFPLAAINQKKLYPKIIEVERKEEQGTPFEKWMMPPQPQAYIKCYGNDFL